MTTKAQKEWLRSLIIEAIEQDKPVSVRGVFYRVVALGGVKKTEQGYETVRRQLYFMRMEGEVPFSHIVDGTRSMSNPGGYSSVSEFMDGIEHDYTEPIWPEQECRVFLVSEKETIDSIVAPVAARWQVPFGICHGFGSITFAHDLAGDIMCVPDEHEVYVYNIGDDDPSGVKAWNAFARQVWEFTGRRPRSHYRRIAVTPEQVEELGLMTRPTKHSNHSRDWDGRESCELDTIPASTLRSMVEDTITSHIDMDIYRATQERIRAARRQIREAIDGIA